MNKYHSISIFNKKTTTIIYRYEEGYKLFDVFNSSDTDGAKIPSQDARLVLSDH